MTDEKLIRAKDATRYDIVGMSADRFEQMVARLVRLEFRRAFDHPLHDGPAHGDLVVSA